MSQEEENRIDPQSSDEMGRRTRRVRVKRKPKQLPSEVQRDAARLGGNAYTGRGQEDQSYGPIDVNEQVRRMRGRSSDDGENLDEVWGTKKRSSTWLWFLLFGIIGSVVAITIGMTQWMKVEEKPAVLNDFDFDFGKVVEVSVDEGPLAWFHSRSIEVLDEAKRIISRMNRSISPDQVSELLRPSSNRLLNPLTPEAWGSSLLLNSTSGFKWNPIIVRSPTEAGVDERGALKVSGTREDGDRFEVYFVWENDRLLLDWDASSGWCDIPLASFIEDKRSRTTLLRCRVTKKPAFDQDFGDLAHSGYLLSGERSDLYCLAYVPLIDAESKVLDRQLKRLLNYGSGVTDEPPLEDVKAMVRVRFNNDRGNGEKFEIVEFLNNEWVTP